MKKVELKTVKVTDSITLDYKEQIVNFLSTPLNPQAGTNYDEMSKVLPVIAKVRDCESPYVLLEDAEHALLAERAKAARFTVNNPEIFAMVDYIIKGETVPAVGVRDAAAQ